MTGFLLLLFGNLKEEKERKRRRGRGMPGLVGGQEGVQGDRGPSGVGSPQAFLELFYSSFVTLYDDLHLSHVVEQLLDVVRVHATDLKTEFKAI